MKNIRIVNFRYNPNFYNSHDYIDYVFWKEFLRLRKVKGTISHPNISKGDSLDSIFCFRGEGRISLLLRYLSCLRSRHIIIQSYEEHLLFFWLILWRLLQPHGKIFIVATNNITHRRLSKLYIRVFYRLAGSLGVTCILHSRAEREILGVYAKIPVILKRYHMWMEVLRMDNSKCRCVKGSLMYPGPIKQDKPKRYILDFFKINRSGCLASIDTIFLLNCDVPELTSRMHCKSFSNVTWQELRDLYSKSEFIFFPHDKTYEGKLSGNLIDAIYFERPIISNAIEPVKEYFTDFGDLGIIYDYDGLGEIKLANMDLKKVNKNLQYAKQSHLMSNIHRALIRDLEI